MVKNKNYKLAKVVFLIIDDGTNFMKRVYTTTFFVYLFSGSVNKLDCLVNFLCSTNNLGSVRNLNISSIQVNIILCNYIYFVYLTHAFH
jgi:hypothetical protein